MPYASGSSAARGVPGVLTILILVSRCRSADVVRILTGGGGLQVEGLKLFESGSPCELHGVSNKVAQTKCVSQENVLYFAVKTRDDCSPNHRSEVALARNISTDQNTSRVEHARVNTNSA